jgi:hypothetical protein
VSHAVVVVRRRLGGEPFCCARAEERASEVGRAVGRALEVLMRRIVVHLTDFVDADYRGSGSGSVGLDLYVGPDLAGAVQGPRYVHCVTRAT